MSGGPFTGDGYDWWILGGVILVQVGLAIGAVSANVRRRPLAEVGGDSGEVGSPGENWVLAGHVSGLFGILPAVIIYLLCRRVKGYPLEQAKESLNFQLPIVLTAMLSLLPNGLLLPVIFLAGIIFPLVAAIRVPQVAHYRYPVSLRLVR